MTQARMATVDLVGGPSRDRTGDRWIKRRGRATGDTLSCGLTRQLSRLSTIILPQFLPQGVALVFALLALGCGHRSFADDPELLQFAQRKCASIPWAPTGHFWTPVLDPNAADGVKCALSEDRAPADDRGSTISPSLSPGGSYFITGLPEAEPITMIIEGLNDSNAGVPRIRFQAASPKPVDLDVPPGCRLKETTLRCMPTLIYPTMLPQTDCDGRPRTYRVTCKH